MLYDIGLLIFSVFYLPTLLFKGKLHGDFVERFGIYDGAKRSRLASTKDKIWIQAVSVGEVALCRSLIPLLNEKFPHHDIILSTITRAGNDLARKIFPEGRITVIYFPLDFSSIVKKVVGLIRPRLYIMIETEIWPNLLKELHANRIPAILINGRISDRSFGKYQLARPFLKNILNNINQFCMQSDIDSGRIKKIGAQSDKVMVTGNMKFDYAAAKVKEPKAIRESLGMKDAEELFVAGSTHRGEEEILIDVFKGLAKDFPRLKLLIAPRHIERSGEVEKIVRQFGFEAARVSSLSSKLQAPTCPPARGFFCGRRGSKQILILDTIGQLNDIYSIATLVFIGGSLVKHGGQNPIEPALFEKAVLFGPHMFNFRSVADIFLKNKAAIQISDKEELSEKAEYLLRNFNERRTLGERAKKIVLENRGATNRNLSVITRLIAQSPQPKAQI